MAKHPSRPAPFRRTFIRAWRKRAGMTQAQLAEKVDMVPSNLSMLENGQRGYTQETIEAIAVALGTDVSSLVSRPPPKDDDEPDILHIWQRASPGHREKIIDIAKIVIKPDT